MPKIDALFPRAALDEAISSGHVRVQTHPDLPLSIYNYTEKAAYDGVWNEVTLQCRGLIVNDDGDVVARPFRKFFNYGQAGAPELDLDARVVVTDKLDGSLGILYPMPDGHAMATRVSFTSDQALHATKVWNERYEDSWSIYLDGVATYLFEIVYPENRIVVNYGKFDDLILLGALNNETGKPDGESQNLLDQWFGPCADIFDYSTLAEALEAEPRPNAEGYVIYFPDHDERLKIKQEDYVALHRIVTGLNARTVWEHLCAGLPIEDLIAPLPDEFHEWVRGIEGDLTQGVNDRKWEINYAYENLLRGLGPDFSRKDFAMAAKEREDSWAMFSLLDGRDIVPELWKRAKPAAFLTPVGHAFSEDTA